MELEHCVQDAQSDDGTLDWLPQREGIILRVEQDEGMYDAINRGFKRTDGEICAYLNCDEQYLVGALELVRNWFAEHPDMDICFGHTIGIKTSGEFVCYRKAILPRQWHTLSSHLTTLSASMFFRRRVLDSGFCFDESFRALGDCEWISRLLKGGLRMGILPAFTSAYMFTGGNLSLSDVARQEKARLADRVPWMVRRLNPCIVLHHRLRKLLAGAYRSDPIRYEIFTTDLPAQRREFTSGEGRPSWRWP